MGYHLIDMFKFIGRGIATASKFIFMQQALNTKEGAKLLKNNEIEQFLSARNKGLLLDGQSRRLSENESYQNVCLAARVGSGKTTKYIIPNVLDKATQDCSIAIHDPKGEIFNLTSGYLEQQGYNIVVYDVQNPDKSNCFNPCWDAKSEVELEQIAETLIWAGNPSQGEKYWNNGASRILSVLLKCLSHGEAKYFNIVNLHHLLQKMGDMGEGLDDWIAINGWNPKYPDDKYLIDEWKGAVTGNEGSVNSFISNCLTALRALTNRDLKRFFHTSDYKLSNFRKEKTAIFFITPPEQQAYYSFVTSLFFKSLFNECMRKEHIQTKPRPAYILYDEFGNSFIPDFMSVANTIRGYGVSLSIILQTISQLEEKYTRAGSMTIQGAMNTNICLSGADPSTANYFSDVSGKVRDLQTSELANPLINHQEYNLINSNEVRTMHEDQVLVISKNRNPAIIPIKPFYEVRKWVKRSKIAPYIIDTEDRPQTVPLVTV